MEELSFWCTEENSFVVAKGDYALCVGASSGDLRCRETVFVDGKEADTRDGGRWISAIDTQNYRRAQFLTDKRDGKEYLDFASGIGVMALGYNKKEYNEALKNQVDKLMHTSNL